MAHSCIPSPGILRHLPVNIPTATFILVSCRKVGRPIGRHDARVVFLAKRVDDPNHLNTEVDVQLIGTGNVDRPPLVGIRTRIAPSVGLPLGSVPW